MASVGGRRLGAAVLAVVLGSLVGGVRPAAATGAVDLTATAGYGGAGPQPRGWLPLKVTLASRGDGFTGILELDPGPSEVQRAPDTDVLVYGARTTAFGPAGSAVIQRHAVTVVAGQSRQLTFWAAPADAYDLTLRDGSGSVVARTTARVWPSTGLDLEVAVVSRVDAALTQLDGLTLGSQPVRVVRLRPENLPEDAVLLSGFAAIVFDGADADRMTRTQRQAVKDYLGQGGGVVVTGRPPFAGGASPLRLFMPGVRAIGVVQLPALTTTAALLGLPAPTDPAPALQVDAARGGTVLLGESGTPVLVAGRAGAGRTALLALDVDADAIRAWAGTPALLRQALAEVSPPTTDTGATGGFPDQSYGPKNIDEALVRERPWEPVPDPRLLWGGLPAYLMVAAGGVSLARRRWWPAARFPPWSLAAIALLSVGAFYVGVGGLPNTPIQRMRVLHVDGVTGRTYVEAFTGVVTDKLGAHAIGPAGSLLATDLAALLGDPQRIVYTNPSPTPRTLTVAPEMPADPVSVSVSRMTEAPNQTFYSATAYGTEAMSDAGGGGLTEDLTLSGAMVSGSVVSHLPFEIQDAAVITGGAAAGWVGTVRPDAPTRVSFVADAYGRLGYSSEKGYPGAMLPVVESGGWWQQLIGRRRELLDAVFPGRSALRSDPVLAGWMAPSSGTVSFDGRPAPLEEATLVVIPLHPRPVAGRSFAPGSVELLPVDPPGGFSGEFASVAPRLRPGEAARFEARLAPGSTWKDLRLGLTYETTCRAQPSSTVPAPVRCFLTGTEPDVEAFDWVANAWVAIPQTATWLHQTADLGPATNLVSPSGVVEIRLSGTRGASDRLAGITLSGDA